MNVRDALDMYEDSDAREDGYEYSVRAKGHRRARREKREAAQKAKEQNS